MWLEIANNVIQLLESLKATAENIDILWVGNICDITEPNGYMLNINCSLINGGAELAKRIIGVEDGVHNIIFPHTL